MTSNYLYKKCFNTLYKLNKKDTKVGQLTDNQLDFAYNLLRSRYKKTKIQRSQFKSIIYIRRIRSSQALEELKSEHGSKMIKIKTDKITNVIFNWLGRVTTLKIELLDKKGTD